MPHATFCSFEGLAQLDRISPRSINRNTVPENFPGWTRDLAPPLTPPRLREISGLDGLLQSFSPTLIERLT